MLPCWECQLTGTAGTRAAGWFGRDIHNTEKVGRSISQDAGIPSDLFHDITEKFKLSLYVFSHFHLHI